MRKQLRLLAATMLANLFAIAAFAQSVTVKGTVKNSSSKEVVSAVSVLIKGTQEGTYTDDKGNFSITTTAKLPFTLLVSSVGFEAKEIQVTSASQVVNVDFVPAAALGQEVVISATRTPQRILESPVSIERLGAQAIRESPLPNYYDNVRNLKGVDVVSSGMLFATPTTRGFAGSGNARLNQIVDGMDNQAPGLNFPVGNSVGLTELDVDNMELLPGASSALYGSGGMNGTLLINSKNPYKYQGLSAQVKQGINRMGSQQAKPAAYYDWALRWAKNFNNKFAFKATAQYVQAKDWQSTDYRNYNRQLTTVDGTDRNTNPAYDGINVYGDETNYDMTAVSGGVFGNLNTLNNTYLSLRATISGAGINPDAIPNPLPTGLPPALVGAITAYQTQVLPAINSLGGPAAVAAQVGQWRLIDSVARVSTNKVVSRTGYNEAQVVDYNTFNFKGNFGLFYKINPSTEISWASYFGTGTTVYTGSDRYSLRNYKIWQHKLEAKGRNWFARAWTTQEDAGDAYNATAIMRILNEAQKPTFSAANLAGSWAPQYAGAYTQAYMQARGAGLTPAQAEAAAHPAARSFADAGRLQPGQARYKAIFDSIAKVPISKGGAQFLDKSDMYMLEGQYKFDQIKEVDITVGALWKQYVLNSQGTLFADTAGRIKINEFGGFVQLQKAFFEDRLKINLAGRYDKNSNFTGRFTPRATALFKIADDNNFRVSYQQAYRFPTTQNQWINLPAGSAIILGGLQSLRDFYKFNTNPVYTVQNVTAYGAAFQSAYAAALQAGQTQAQAFGTAAASSASTLKPYQFKEYKAESMSSVEFGYKGLLAQKHLLVDGYVFFSTYNDFLGRVNVIQSKSQLASPLKETGLIQQNPDATTNGSRQVYSVSVNAAEKVKVFGWGISADYNFNSGFSLGGNLAVNDLKENNLPAGFLSYWSTPKTRYNVYVAHNKINKVYGFNLSYRWQSSMFYESDFAIGNVPSFGSLDLQVSRRFPAIRSVLKVGGSNILNQYYQTGFANPSIGGLLYMSFGYNIF